MSAIGRAGRALRFEQVRAAHYGDEALAIGLRRLANPNRLCDLELMFGRLSSTLSIVSNQEHRHIAHTFGHLLRDLTAHSWLNPDQLDVLAESEKSEWLSPSEIPTPGKTTGFWDSSIGPPPPSPVFGFAHATPMTSSPKVPATISSAVLALSPEIGFSTARHGVHGHRLGRIQGPSGRTPIPVLLTSPPKNPASAAASAVLVLSPEAGPPISRFGAISDGQRQAPCRLRSVRSLGTPRAERSPAEADVARSPQRGIGQRMKSFFTRTVRWKAPRDHAPTRLDIAPHLRVPSPVFRFHSSSKIGLMRERVPTFIRKSLRRRSGKYSMGARHQE
ncbi:hypothetical protein HPB47_014155 [Ixodes persulcatus]|uniref:Uncharacterized protein n=1 Tax=Ixodes persulcatus TaxID=34615 RepID=A0AC60QWP6_IXOPE|nr:hypothetical protein HPB47_014155 [Ixodes persulcatus]